MEFCNLDMTVRRTLLERGLPIHYYPEVLYHQSAALRELSRDSLMVINTVNLALNDYNAADLPDDFVDDVGVGVPVGNMLHPIPKTNSITPLRNINGTTGQFQNFSDSTNTETVSTFGVNPMFIWYWNYNDYGEPTGRFFGAGGGNHRDMYQIFPERRQIQFTESFGSPNAVLQYISNGQSVDNATQIDWAAFRAIQTYSDWQRSPNATMKDSPEARTFYNERRLLRAAKNSLTITDIKQILRESYKATIKN